MDFADGMNGIDMNALAGLIKESGLAAQSREVETVPPVSSAPMNIRKGGGVADQKAQIEIDPLMIWSENEIRNEEDIINLYDRRPAPRFELYYKQTVGSEDVFLGMSDISPSSGDCTHIVVKIHFPGSTMKALDLDVTKNRIRASSPTHKLFTYLPVDVDGDHGSAKFDARKEVLTVTLPIVFE